MANYGITKTKLNDVSKVFAGISNNITINNIIEGSANYIPKIYPTNNRPILSK